MRIGKDVARRVEDNARTGSFSDPTSACDLGRYRDNARRCLLVERGGRHRL